MYCLHCGTVLPEESRYCSKCGESILQATQTEFPSRSNSTKPFGKWSFISIKNSLTKFDKFLLIIFAIVVIANIVNPPRAYFNLETGKFIESTTSTDDRTQIYFTQLFYNIFGSGIVILFITFTINIIIRTFRKPIATKIDTTNSTETIVDSNPLNLVQERSFAQDAPQLMKANLDKPKLSDLSSEIFHHQSNGQNIEIGPELTKRPKLVWVIAIFILLSACWTALSFALIYSGAIPINEAQKAYFASQNILDIILTITMSTFNILGAILLLLLRRYAFHCFLTAFSIGVLMYAYQIMFKNWLDGIGGPGLVGAVIGWGISIAIIIYSSKLVKREILR